MGDTTTATVLFTDLIGSTALRASLGEEAADELRRAHDAVLAQAVLDNGGRVVKSTGDGIVAAFEAAVDGLDGAVACQQAVAHLRRSHGIELAIRVGLSVGDVSSEEGDVHGTPVIEAARLEAAASGGQILCSDLVKMMARGRGGHEFFDIGELKLKGLPEPLVTFEVRWSPAPRLGSALNVTPFVGREHESARLHEAYASADEGAGGLVLISGEPGIGKSRLVEEFLAELNDSVVLLGSCRDGESAPFAPWNEAIGNWARETDDVELRRLLGNEGPVLCAAFAPLRELLPDIDEPLPVPPEVEQPRLHDAISQLLERLVEGQSALIVLDDLHWADEGTIDLLRAVSRHALGRRLLVVGSYRESDLDRLHPLTTALEIISSEAQPTRIALRGLVPDEVQRLLARWADQDVTKEQAAAINAETAGNPFFVRETVLYLVEIGEFRQEDGVWVTPDLSKLRVPQGARDVIGRRLSRLSDDANALLSVGAGFDGGIPFQVAASVSGLNEAEALDALDEALAAGILAPSGGFDEYEFSHALIRHTLYEEMNPSRQVRLHRLIAEELEQQLPPRPSVPDVARVVHHYERSAALPGAEAGVDFALQLAQSASIAFATHDRVDALQTALELMAPSDDREPPVRGELAEAVIGTVPDLQQVLDVAGKALELQAQTDGDDAAADLAADLVGRARAFSNSALAWGLARQGRTYLRDERRDRTWFQIRLAEVTKAESEDPEAPGIPTDSPERRELTSVFAALDVEDRDGLTGYEFGAGLIDSREHGLAQLEAGWFGGREWSLLVWHIGDYEAGLLALEQEIEMDMAAGRFGFAVMGLHIAARVESLKGNRERYEAVMGRGRSVVTRLSPLSSAVFAWQVAESMWDFEWNRDLDGFAAKFQPLLVIDNAELSWVLAAIRGALAVAFIEGGQHEYGLQLLEENLPAIDRAPAGTLNHVNIVCSAADALFSADSTEHLELVERNLRTKVVEPDLRYPESDGRLAMGCIAALRGDANKSRLWFERARSEMSAVGNRYVWMRACECEALAELRLGDPDQRPRFEELIAMARAEYAARDGQGGIAYLDSLVAKADQVWS